MRDWVAGLLRNEDVLSFRVIEMTGERRSASALRTARSDGPYRSDFLSRQMTDVSFTRAEAFARRTPIQANDEEFLDDCFTHQAR